uniref:NADP-dependent oxidoreductase domain-containing protein n=1 Tax=Leptobrachium leishanense TaxID=445787 RepID=A0A8C5Q728_9ANUR
MERCEIPTVALASGQHIPILGLGMSHIGGYSHNALLHALRNCGINHIDTAKRYGNEAQVGKAIAESGVKREELWITTKLWPGDYGYQNAMQACLDSSKRLGLEYLGVCRSIGVSNFLVHHLEQLKEDCSVVPHLNQVEFHPFQRPQELMDYCRRNNIVFGGYCPLAKGQALTHPVIQQLAKSYGRTPAQICIRWSIQNGAITIPKSTKEERIEENCKVFDFSLMDEDVATLNSLHDGRHVSWDPTNIL